MPFTTFNPSCLGSLVAHYDVPFFHSQSCSKKLIRSVPRLQQLPRVIKRLPPPPRSNHHLFGTETCSAQLLCTEPRILHRV